MSDNIPMDIQVDIMKRLPVRSLFRFRSVSNTWKSLIDSPRFKSSYSAQVQHLLLINPFHGSYDSRNNYLLIVDDDSFPRHKDPVPFPREWFCYRNLCGCSNGLLCFLGSFRSSCGDRNSGIALIWNPSIRKAIDVDVPNIGCEMIYEFNLGFGVCRETMDPKIVKIVYIKEWHHIESVASIPWQVEVCTLSTGAWRSSYSNFPRKSIRFNCSKIVVQVDGFLYWLATDRIAVDGGFRCYNVIVSFDLTSEVFSELKIPDSLAYEDDITRLSMYKLRESLVIVHEKDRSYTVCTMEDGVPIFFTKPFNLKTEDAYLRGFRKGGEPVIEIFDNDCPQLAVYDFQSKQIDNLRIDGTVRGFQVFPYMETMLLLDHPGSGLYSEFESRKQRTR